MRPESLEALIDEAVNLCGGGRALARRLGVPEHHPHEWRAGKRAVTPETAALLADVLSLSGEDARELVALAVVENPKNAEKRERLRRALFACWVGGVALSLHAMMATPVQAAEVAVNRLHIVAHRLLRLMGGTWLALGAHQGLRPRYPGTCGPRFAAPPLG